MAEETISKKLQLKRNLPDSLVTSYTPDVAEPIYDTNRKQLRIGDGTTPGGVIPSEFYTTDIINSNYTVDGNTVVMADCSSNSFTVTLPANPFNGMTVKIVDVYYAASETQTITVTSASDKIGNENESFVIDVPRSFVSFVYVAAAKNWFVDVGGVILPSYEIGTTEELEWTDAGLLGVRQVSFEKIVGPMDLGEF